MATLIGPVPPGLTFQDLVGGTGTRTPSSLLPSPEQDSATPQDRSARDQLMRISLPEGAVHVMTLTRHDEFLLSYSIQHNTAVMDLQGVARKEVEQSKAEP